MMLFQTHVRTCCFWLGLLFGFYVSAQPTLTNQFIPNTIGPGSASSLTFTITNDSGTPVSALSFTNILPAELTIDDPSMATTDCNLGISGTLDAPDGGSTINLTDAQIGAFQSCTITVAITASTPGLHTHPAVTLNSSAGSSMSLPTDLTVATDRPGFSKSFSPPLITFGSRSRLTFTIDNSSNATQMINLNFSDNLPSGMQVANPPDLSNDCTNAIVTATPGSSQVTLSGAGFIDPAGVCQVSLDVLASSSGVMDNQSSQLISSNGVSQFSSGFATASLEAVASPIHLTKSFDNDPVSPGSLVNMTFTVQNFDRQFAATAISFTDDLTTLTPALPGLVFDALLSNNCGAVVSGVGSTLIDVSNGSLAASGSCEITVQLAVPAGAIAGNYLNTTSTITGTVDGSPVAGNQASETLFVNFAPIFTKEFIDDPAAAGGSVTLRFTVTNTDPNQSLTGLQFNDDIGGTVDPRAGTVPNMAANSLVDGTGLSPDPMVDPCGAGSTLTIPDPNDTLPSPPFPNLPPDPTLLVFSGGNLTAAGTPGDSCTFDVVLDIPVETPTGIYPNTTSNLISDTETFSSAQDDLFIIGAPQLTQSFTDDPVAPGGTVTLAFTLSLSENAPTAATNISFTEDLNLGIPGLIINLPTTPDPPCGAGSSMTAPGNVLTLTGATLQPAESCDFEVTVDIPLAATPGIYNYSSSNVSANIDGISTLSGPANDNLVISGLSFNKEFLGDPVIAGDTVTLRYTIENVHPSEDATNMAFSDNLANVLPGVPDLIATLPPATNTCGGTMTGPTSLSYTGGSVLVGNLCTIDLSILVPAGIADNDYVSTSSALSATQGVAVTVDPAVDILTVNSNVLLLEKTFTDDPVAPGQTVTLEFTVTNAASDTVTNITFTDDLDATLTGLAAVGLPSNGVCGGASQVSGTNFLTLSGAELAAFSSCTFAVTLQVPAGAVVGIYPNTTSSISGDSNGLPVTGNAANDDLNIQNLLDFSMSFDGPSAAGNTAVLSLTINNSTTLAANNMSFTLDLAAVMPGLTALGLPTSNVCGTGSLITGTSFINFSGGQLGVAENCTFDITVQIPMGALAGTYPATTSDLTANGLQIALPASANLGIEPPPTFNKLFAPNSIGNGQISTLTFNVDNSASVLAASNLDFTDNFPAGMVVASPANASTTCTGGTLTAVAGSGTVTYTGGTVAAGSSCTVQLDVTTSINGTFVNTSGNLTSSSGNSGTASDSLTVNPQPILSKTFTPNPIAVGGTSTLQFVIDHSAGSVDATNLAFQDNFPANLVIATPANASTTCTGGTLTAADGTATVQYVGGTVSANSTCSLFVDVTSNIPATYVNVSSTLMSSLGESPTATDTLVVTDSLVFNKVYVPNAMSVGDTSVLTFTLDNSANNVAATAVDFTDNMPANTLIATPSNAVTDCTGGTLTAISGSATLSYTGGTVPQNASCTIAVDITADTNGVYVNTTGDLTSSLGNSGPASDTLTVAQVPDFNKTFTPALVHTGELSTLSFVIDNNANGTDATGLDFIDNLPAGLVVANPTNVTSTCTGGTVTASAGTSTISYSGGTVPANSACQIDVSVYAGVTGTFNNTTEILTSSLGNSGTASATLTVQSALSMVKSFNITNPVNAGDNIEMSLTITNVSSLDATQVSFTDDLGAFIAGATASNLPLNDVCGLGSTVTGSAVISLSNGTINAGASCQILINIDIPATTASGNYINTTSSITGFINGLNVDGGGNSSGTDNVDVLGSVVGNNTVPVPALNLWWMLALLILFLSVTLRYRKYF